MAPITAQAVSSRPGTSDSLLVPGPPVTAPVVAGADAAVAASPLAPASAPKEKFDVVTIQTEDGLELEGSWWEPARKGKPVPGILLVHDAGSDRTQLDQLAEQIMKRRFAAVLSIDLRGHGGSVTESIDWSKATEQERTAMWVFAQKDVDAAVDWLLSQKCVHSTRLCMVGYKAGCALVVRHMRDEDNALAVTLLEPPSEAYGFDIENDLVFLEGLPTKLVGSKENGEKKARAEMMVDKANELAQGENKFFEFLLCKPPLLEDRSALTKIAGFFKAHAQPSRGR